jgi:hypothetical protein
MAVTAMIVRLVATTGQPARPARRIAAGIGPAHDMKGTNQCFQILQKLAPARGVARMDYIPIRGTRAQ